MMSPWRRVVSCVARLRDLCARRFGPDPEATRVDAAGGAPVLGDEVVFRSASFG